MLQPAVWDADQVPGKNEEPLDQTTTTIRRLAVFCATWEHAAEAAAVGHERSGVVVFVADDRVASTAIMSNATVRSAVPLAAVKRGSTISV